MSLDSEINFNPQLGKWAGQAPAISIFDIYRDYVDSQGIHLSSDRVNPALIEGVDFEYQACPFENSPSRFPDGHPHAVPISGLERRRLGENYISMLEVIKLAREGFLGMTFKLGSKDVDRQGPLTAEEMRKLLRTFMYFPHYLVNRSVNSFAPHGELPPVAIILSNCASGSLGALEGCLETYGKNFQTLTSVPDVDKMIEDAEKRGAMVGKKTVCVASPAQMRHFLSSIINGPEVESSRFDPRTLFNPMEIVQMGVFGHEAYEVNDMLSNFRTLDTLTADSISEAYGNGNHGRVAELALDYMGQAGKVLANLEARQSIINQTLGRSMDRTGPTLDDLIAQNFIVPQFIQRHTP